MKTEEVAFKDRIKMYLSEGLLDIFNPTKMARLAAENRRFYRKRQEKTDHDYYARKFLPGSKADKMQANSRCVNC